jgi:signal transduction histidine kinase
MLTSVGFSYMTLQKDDSERPAFGTSIKVRIFILISLIILPALIVLVVLFMKSIRYQLDQASKDICIAIAENMRSWFSVMDIQNPQLGKELKYLTNQRDRIRVIDVFLVNEKILLPFATSRDTTILPTPKDYDVLKTGSIEAQHKLVGEEPVMDISLALERDGKRIGVLHTIITEPKTALWLAGGMTNLLIGTVVLMLLVAIALFAYMNIAVTAPIKRLVDGMQKATRGELHTVVQATTSGELGWLTLVFNRMMRQISQFNKQLQEKIKEATSELEEKNRELISVNEKLFTLQHKLIQAERLASLGQLSAQLAHELGTTLNVISGHIQLLQSEAGGQVQSQRLSVIQTQLDRLTSIIRNVLKTMKLPEPRLESVNVNKVLKDITTFISPTLASRNIVLETSFEDNLPETMGDKHQLEQVFMNLITNAIESMENGGVLRVETCKTTNLEYGKCILIKFTDTGIGIKEEDMKRLFEPFFSTKKDAQGSGLGLAISKEIIKNHNGQILVSSKLGQGSVFTVELPTQKNDG